MQRKFDVNFKLSVVQMYLRQEEEVQVIAEKMGIENPVIKFEGYRESDPERRLLSTEKIRTRTNWKPIVDLDKGLDECVENYMNI